MYNIVVCDDESEILKNIVKSVRTHFESLNIKATVKGLTNSKELLRLMENEVTDVLFLDIDMPYFNGMDIAKLITEKGLKTLLVFVTSHDALVYQTFSYRPFGFIRKAYFENEIGEVISRLEKELPTLNEKLVLKKNQEVLLLRKEDICYMESEGNYINIYTENEVERYRDTLADMEEKLGTDNFVRCHKGYLVNAKYIVRIRQNELELKNGLVLPIGRSYEKEVKQKILESMRR